MRFAPLAGVSLRSTPPVTAYLSGAGPIARRFAHLPFAAGALARRASELADRRGADPVALSQALVSYNEAIGADAATLAAAQRLAAPGALAVITGQQAGAATGPLYTIYKAITVLRLARRQEEALGVPVVPVFWVASEDHDFAEIARVEVPGPDGGWVSAELGDPPPGRVSVGHIPARDRALAFLAALAGCLPRSEFKDGVVSDLRADALAAGNLADWFARVMARLFAGTGLVFVSPMIPAIRRLQAPFFRLALSRYEGIQAALASGIAGWTALGFEPTLEQRLGATGLFMYVDGQRQPLMGAGEYLWVRDQPEMGWSRDQLLDMAQRTPERFSTGVTLRPVVQDWLFPDLAYVGGPGEIAYFGVLRETFAAAGQSMPIIWPRVGATLVEPTLARYMEKQGLDLAEVFAGLEEKKQAFLAESDPIGQEALFADLRGAISSHYDRAADQLKALGGDVPFAIEEARKQVTHHLQRLQEKAKQQHRKNCDTGLRQLSRLGDHLVAGGRLQERVGNITYFAVKYGPEMVAELIQQLPVADDRWQHLAVYI